MTISTTAAGDDRDHGAVLPLVLVVSVVLSLVVVALATYVTTDLRYAQVTAARAERQAASTSAITYGVERIRLGKTLCSSAAADIGYVQPGIIDRNNTTTTLSCSRFASGLSDITGWAIVMTGEGIASDYLNVQGGGTKTVKGPMFIQDVNQVTFVGGGTAVDHISGDLWHHRGPCPGGPVTLPGTYNFIPANARGPICTISNWNQVVSTPTVPDFSIPPFSTLPVNDGTVFAPNGTCRVFSPGRYTGVPQVPDNVNAYFRSGNYLFDSIGTWTVKRQTIWFGHPGALAGSEELANPDCIAARNADLNLDGAVAYLGGNSAISAITQGALEFFPRLVSGKRVSLQALETGPKASTVTAASGNHIYRVAPGSVADSVIHGMVWAPNGWFGFDNSSNAAKQKLLGGAVVSRMSIQASSSASGFEISVATTPFASDILLTATSTSSGGATTTARAVVEYRVDEPDPTKKVAVNSLRILD